MIHSYELFIFDPWATSNKLSLFEWAQILEHPINSENCLPEYVWIMYCEVMLEKNQII